MYSRGQIDVFALPAANNIVEWTGLLATLQFTVAVLRFDNRALREFHINNALLRGIPWCHQSE